MEKNYNEIIPCPLQSGLYPLGTAADCANFSAPPDSPTNSSITVLSSVSTLNNNNYTVLAVDFGDDNEAYDVIYNSSAPHKLYHSYLESDVYILTILAYN